MYPANRYANACCGNPHCANKTQEHMTTGVQMQNFRGNSSWESDGGVQINNYLEPTASTFSSPNYSTSLNGYNTPYENTPDTEQAVYMPVAQRGFDDINSQRLANMQLKNKRAVDGVVRNTANNFSKYFQEEMAYNESRDWYSESADDGDLGPYEY